ncbi:MAG TPA: serine/threonine-protein kinase [Kofleriaceae bacterium]|nr:serine/threonine-protein kinase [Kofleriaceae bacterium]
MGTPEDSDHTLPAPSGSQSRTRGDATAEGSTLTESGAVPTIGADLARDTRVGEYVIEEVIGRGGFGTVYRAVQPVIGKRVAIKVLARKYSADTEMVSRFVAEARAVNQIRHRHIIDIFSFSELPDGRQYYVMEHLEGEPLDRYLARTGPLTLDEALPILRAVARALDAAHAKGVAHRDLKPENIFLARDDEGVPFPKLLDFGIAKLSGQEESLAHRTNTGVPIGTPFYMSPEQCRGRDVDHRTDLYSFGVLAYRMLTGAYPFEGNVVEILHQQMHDEPRPPSAVRPGLSTDVDAAIAWMMRKEPAARPATAISAVLALYGDNAPTPAITPSTIAKLAEREPAVPPSRRARWIAPALGIVVLGGAATFYATRDRADESPPVAASRAEPPAPAAAPTPAPPPPSPPPAVPSQVTIEIRGTPPGTEVLHLGKTVGAAPGPVQLPRGDDEVLLTLRAEGYELASQKVRPDHDHAIDVVLAKKPAAPLKKPKKPATKPDDHADPDDLIHVFPRGSGS